MTVDPLLKKLNFKDQTAVYLLNAPESLLLQAPVEVRTRIGKARDISFALAFAQTRKQVDAFADQVATNAAGDAVVWVAYPKGSSKRYTCEFNRDNGWERFGAHGFEPVRQVAIDEDWSALRFRRVEHIKKMTRSFAITEAGKAKTNR